MNTITIEQNVPARMRDGVTLYADVYRSSEHGQSPVLLCRLPYGKDMSLSHMLQSMHVLRAVRSGYIVIIQDCRGRFSSEGQFDYCAHEGNDGYDAVEWAAQLPYSNGVVGMFGGSNLGWTQWSAAQMQPPHLKAIAPMQTWTDHSGMRFRGGAFELGDALRWRLNMSLNKLAREMAAAGKSQEEIEAAIRLIFDYLDYLGERGYYELPLRHIKSLEKVGLADIIGVLLDLAPGKQQDGMRIRHENVDVPSLNIAGWYDVFQQYTIDNFVAIRAKGRDLAARSHLLIGPWTHGGYNNGPGMMVGEINFGMAASGSSIDFKEDITDIHLRWFDHWLKNIDNGVEKEQPVTYLLTGENRWVKSQDWPPAGAHVQQLYLCANSHLSFSRPGSEGGSTSYVYDPMNPAPTLGGNIVLERSGVRDQRSLSKRPDVLTFTSGVLEQPIQVAGRISADLWISSSAPDTDFVARLIDLHPDGYMYNLCDGILRARYRNSLTEAEWLQPNKVYELKVDLWSAAHVFKPEHRLAVQITSSSFPRWDRNWNTTETPGSATGGQTARQTIWHNFEYPSCIYLPVI